MPGGRPRHHVVAPRDDADDRVFKTQPTPARLELEMTIGVKKCVHLQLKADTHVELRRIMIERGITLQSMFEEFACRVVTGDDYTEDLLQTCVDRRNDAALAASRVDTEALLAAIKSAGPEVKPTSDTGDES